jgi:hypothetical protein
MWGLAAELFINRRRPYDLPNIKSGSERVIAGT